MSVTEGSWRHKTEEHRSFAIPLQLSRSYRCTLYTRTLITLIRQLAIASLVRTQTEAKYCTRVRILVRVRCELVAEATNDADCIAQSIQTVT